MHLKALSHLDLDLGMAAELSEGFTGAEIEGACRATLMDLVEREAGGGGTPTREEAESLLEAKVGLVAPILQKEEVKAEFKRFMLLSYYVLLSLFIELF